MRQFFSISYSFIDWMFKRRLIRYTFHFTDDKYPNYTFSVVVERKKNDNK